MEKLTLINGNKQEYTRELPKIVILTKYPYNDVALEHIKANTGLEFKRCFGGMDAQPKKSDQIVKLLLTYDFKTQYHDNSSSPNTLFLKSDHHVGFRVNSICFDCCKHNNIQTNGLKEGDRLSC